jgi:hypothetical protein
MVRFGSSPEMKKAQPITIDRLGWVVVCGGYKDRLSHGLKWWVSPPFLWLLRYVLEKKWNIGYRNYTDLAERARGH